MQAHDDWELANTFEQGTGFGAADGGAKRIQCVFDVETVTAKGGPIHRHHELRCAGDLVGLDFSSAVNLLQECL